MKVTYLERIERHLAFSRNMYCPACRGHKYEIVEQLEPKCDNNWYVRCPQCGAESVSGPTRDVAIARWRQAC